MKKLITILGAFMFTAVVLTSCGDGVDACSCNADIAAMLVKVGSAEKDDVEALTKEMADKTLECAKALKNDPEAYGTGLDCK